MKRFDLGCYLVSSCIGAALLTGCGGPGSPAGRGGSLPSDVARSAFPASMLTGEAFSSTSVSSACGFNGPSQHILEISFQAAGTATGPVPGKFAVHGRIDEPSALRGSGIIDPATLKGTGMHERFTITSGSTEISGKVDDMSGADFKTFHCTGNGNGLFAISNLRYVSRKLPAHGHTEERLKDDSFNQSFQ